MSDNDGNLMLLLVISAAQIFGARYFAKQQVGTTTYPSTYTHSLSPLLTPFLSTDLDLYVRMSHVARRVVSCDAMCCDAALVYTSCHIREWVHRGVRQGDTWVQAHRTSFHRRMISYRQWTIPIIVSPCYLYSRSSSRQPWPRGLIASFKAMHWSKLVKMFGSAMQI